MDKEELSKKNRRAAISRWRKYEEEINNRIRNSENTMGFHKYFALIHGYLAGDGSICIRREKNRKKAKHFDIEFYPDNHNMLTSYIRAFKNYYGLTPKTVKRDNHFVVRIASKVVAKHILQYGSLRSESWKIPIKIYEDKHLLKMWLRAFFDSEAHISNKVIRIESVNLQGVVQIKKALEVFSIESKIYLYKRKNVNWKDNHILCIMKKESRVNYLKQIGFYHSEKLKKLVASVAELG